MTTQISQAAKNISLPEEPPPPANHSSDAATMRLLSSDTSLHRNTFPVPSKRATAFDDCSTDRETAPTGEAMLGSPSGSKAPPLSDPFLNLAAAMVDDLERVRMANANRLRILTTPAEQLDEDGVARGFGLTEDHRDVARLAAMVKALEVAEHDAVLTLQAVMRRHPLGPWVKSQIGIGEKQAARLLASIGDPYWHDLHNRPRTVSQLWAYSGLHVVPGGQSVRDARERSAAGVLSSSIDLSQLDAQALHVNGGQPGGGNLDQDKVPLAHGDDVGVAASRKKGVKANWSADAKTRAYLIALSCIKQAKSPYRVKYDERRARTAITHPEWTPAHSHNDGLRIAAKEVLKQLWRESRRLHGVTDEQD